MSHIRAAFIGEQATLVPRPIRKNEDVLGHGSTNPRLPCVCNLAALSKQHSLFVGNCRNLFRRDIRRQIARVISGCCPSTTLFDHAPVDPLVDMLFSRIFGVTDDIRGVLPQATRSFDSAESNDLIAKSPS